MKMNQIFKTLALLLAGAFLLAGCEDVPAPYAISRPTTPDIVEPDPVGDGTVDAPFNVTAAIRLAKSLPTSSPSDNSSLSEVVYVKGIVSNITKIEPDYGNATYYIADEITEDGVPVSQIQVYRGKALGGAEFTSDEQLSVGDTVIVKGQLKNFNGTLEFNAGSEIVYQSGHEIAPPAEPEGDGTFDNPYNVSAVLQLFASGEAADKWVYVKGIVTSIKSLEVPKFKRAQYYISDDGTSSHQFYIFNGYYLGGAAFTSNDQLKVGDEVVVYGQLGTYQGTDEMKADNYLAALNGKWIPKPADPNTIDNPYTVEEALELISSGMMPAAEVYVRGIVNSIDEISIDHGNATYHIGSTSQAEKTLKIYRGRSLDGAFFTSEDELKVGDEVIVKGRLINYEESDGTFTPEVSSGSQIVWLNGQIPPQVDPNNSIENPYSAEDALLMLRDNQAPASEVYVKGIVDEIQEINLQHGNATYYIALGLGYNLRLLVYRGFGLGGESFTSDDDLLVGDEVIVYGRLVNFKDQNGTTPEIASGNKIVWLNGQTPEEPEPGDAQGDGTKESPFNINGANAYITAGQNLDQEVYVEGIISEIRSLDVSRWQRAQYYISNDGTTAGQFLIFNGYYLGGADFTSNDQIKVGDRVVVLGKLKNFQGTNEMDSNNKIVCLNGQWAPDEPEPEPGPTPGSEGDIAFTSYDISSGATGSVSLVSNAYGQQAVATKSTWYSFKAGGIEWTGCRMCIAPDVRGGGIQIQGNASDTAKQGFMYNTTALPEMKTIVITAHVDAGSQYGPSFNVYIGTSENPSNAIQGSQSKTTQNGLDIYTFTYDVSSTSSTYMKIWNNLQGALYLDKVEVFKK